MADGHAISLFLCTLEVEFDNCLRLASSGKVRQLLKIFWKLKWTDEWKTFPGFVVSLRFVPSISRRISFNHPNWGLRWSVD